MKFDPEIHHRRSIRLRDYDYGTTGAYFVTVCVAENPLKWAEDRENPVNVV